MRTNVCHKHRTNQLVVFNSISNRSTTPKTKTEKKTDDFCPVYLTIRYSLIVTSTGRVRVWALSKTYQGVFPKNDCRFHVKIVSSRNAGSR